MARFREGQARSLKPEQFQQVIDFTNSNSKHKERDCALLQVSYRMGLRVAEIAALTIDDVLNMDGTINTVINLRKKTTKGKKGGQAFLSHPQLREFLRVYLDIRLEMEVDSRVLFLSQKNVGFSPSSMSRLFTNLYNKAGAYGCTSHSGRRSLASTLNRNGSTIYQIKSVLRHSNVQTTCAYIDNDEEELSELLRTA